MTIDSCPDRSDPVRYQIDCRLDYTVDTDCDCVFMIHVASTPRQRMLAESLSLSAAQTAQQAPRLFDDAAGNRVMRLQARRGALRVDYRAQVALWPQPPVAQAAEWPIGRLPDAVLPDLLPTRYCESDRLGPAARQLFGAIEPGLPRVQAICHWLRQNVEYRIGSTQSTSSALDVFVQRAGVCRDFAHLGISFCRALNIPARLVSGYAAFDEPPPDFHAVFEAFLGGRWRLFDATGLAPVDALVRIAQGRDAKDVAFATLYGAARLDVLSPQVRPLAPAAEPVAQRRGFARTAAAAPCVR